MRTLLPPQDVMVPPLVTYGWTTSRIASYMRRSGTPKYRPTSERWRRDVRLLSGELPSGGQRLPDEIPLTAVGIMTYPHPFSAFPPPPRSSVSPTCTSG